MVSKVISLGLNGVEGFLVEVECATNRGLPSFDIIGLPDLPTKEAKQRVKAAIKSAELQFPVSNITVHLSPASIKKSGSHFDLPILISILSATDQIKSIPNDTAFIGELSLSGEIKPVSGVLPMALFAKQQGIKTLFVPYQNQKEASFAEMQIIPILNITQLLNHLKKDEIIAPAETWIPNNEEEYPFDFSDVKGQQSVKRVLEICAAGGHNLLMLGSKGSGKTMLGKRVISILPKMTKQEQIETTQIYSVANLTNDKNPVITTRPFQNPHHTISRVGMIGGVNKPGLISLSHNGILYLDEVLEFPKSILESLRLPLEDRKVQVVRANASVTYPCDFMLIGSTNLCPCGWYPSKKCTCSQSDRERYTKRLSGPLVDRIDCFVEVYPLEFSELSSKPAGESSSLIRERVNKAREIQNQRGTINSRFTPDMMENYCSLNADGQKLMKEAYDKLGLSARSYDRIRKVARTIADLDNSPNIEVNHIAEALQYRPPEYLQ